MVWSLKIKKSRACLALLHRARAKVRTRLKRGPSFSVYTRGYRHRQVYDKDHDFVFQRGSSLRRTPPNAVRNGGLHSLDVQIFNSALRRTKPKLTNPECSDSKTCINDESASRLVYESTDISSKQYQQSEHNHSNCKLEQPLNSASKKYYTKREIVPLGSGTYIDYNVLSQERLVDEYKGVTVPDCARDDGGENSSSGVWSVSMSPDSGASSMVQDNSSCSVIVPHHQCNTTSVPVTSLSSDSGVCSLCSPRQESENRAGTRCNNCTFINPAAPLEPIYARPNKNKSKVTTKTMGVKSSEGVYGSNYAVLRGDGINSSNNKVYDVHYTCNLYECPNISSPSSSAVVKGSLVQSHYCTDMQNSSHVYSSDVPQGGTDDTSLSFGTSNSTNTSFIDTSLNSFSGVQSSCNNEDKTLIDIKTTKASLSSSTNNSSSMTISESTGTVQLWHWSSRNRVRPNKGSVVPAEGRRLLRALNSWNKLRSALKVQAAESGPSALEIASTSDNQPSADNYQLSGTVIFKRKYFLFI